MWKKSYGRLLPKGDGSSVLKPPSPSARSALVREPFVAADGSCIMYLHSLYKTTSWGNRCVVRRLSVWVPDWNLLQCFNVVERNLRNVVLRPKKTVCMMEKFNLLYDGWRPPDGSMSSARGWICTNVCFWLSFFRNKWARRKMWLKGISCCLGIVSYLTAVIGLRFI